MLLLLLFYISFLVHIETHLFSPSLFFHLSLSISLSHTHTQISKDEEIKRVREEMRYFKLELLNREENFNSKFGARPNVGVMQVIKPKQPGGKQNGKNGKGGRGKQKRRDSRSIQPGLPPLNNNTSSSSSQSQQSQQSQRPSSDSRRMNQQPTGGSRRGNSQRPQ